MIGLVGVEGVGEEVGRRTVVGMQNQILKNRVNENRLRKTKNIKKS